MQPRPFSATLARQVIVRAPVLRIAALIAVTGCSAKHGGPSSDDDGGTAGPACNELVDLGEAVLDTRVVGAMPSPSGGTIENGTYARTASTYYVGEDAGAATPHRRRETWEVHTGSVERIYQRDADPVETETFAFVVSETTLVETSSCPDTSSITFGFDATPATIRRYNFRYNEIITYTRR
jgi:hypothetical protein